MAHGFASGQPESPYHRNYAATCLERHIYLAVQFLEIGKPVVLALNG
ncbi:FeoB small GTPase domain-containing protein [Pelovirga terrestris]|uniref:Uncharacterized protein n=1 Tax=Pelovirga terrestris TaxID=2771352 RepID=A0A8J6UPZ2_9BACT|nr:hypothetical protein [Pelovirga terrestris]